MARKFGLILLCLWSLALVIPAGEIFAQANPIAGGNQPDPFPGPLDGDSWAVRPGSVYKEYVKPISGARDWRVTGTVYTYDVQEGPNNDPGDFLPNPIITIPVDDLQNAIRVEAVLSYWSGHNHTPNKRFKVNNNAWIFLPDQTTIESINPGKTEDLYLVQSNMVVEIPLSHLQQGNNTFVGDADNQVRPGFGWPQWGWTGIIIRVFYNPTLKTGAPAVTITSPAANTTIVHNQTPITASAPNASQVEILGYYLGLDEDGDGHYQDWHHAYFNPIRGTDMSIKGNIPSGPWDTTLVPNQAGGSIKLIARARAANGLWKVSPRIEGLSLSRNFSVHLFPSTNIPDNYRIAGTGVNSVKSNTLPVPTAFLNNIQSAQIYMRTWNGKAPTDNPVYKFNTATLPLGTELKNHDYAATFHTFPPANVQAANTFTITNSTHEHGVEMLWPSGTLLLRYNVAHNGGTGPTPTNTPILTPTHTPTPGVPTSTPTPLPYKRLLSNWNTPTNDNNADGLFNILDWLNLF